MRPQSLRFVTWLAPSLPLELFELIASIVGAAVGLPWTLAAVADRSGPAPGSDPFTSGQADVGFACAPTYLALRERRADVELLGASPVFDDPRVRGRPIYFSDVVVRSSSRCRALEDLRGGVLAFNDPASQSGWHCLWQRLPGGEEAHTFFRESRRSGSHLGSIALVVAGEADAAAIDSNVLRLALSRSPATAAHVRVLHTLGPWPVQPILVRRSLPEGVKEGLRSALLAANRADGSRRALRRFGVSGFAPVADGDPEWALLGAGESLSVPAAGSREREGRPALPVPA